MAGPQAPATHKPGQLQWRCMSAFWGPAPSCRQEPTPTQAPRGGAHSQQRQDSGRYTAFRDADATVISDGVPVNHHCSLYRGSARVCVCGASRPLSPRTIRQHPVPAGRPAPSTPLKCTGPTAAPRVLCLGLVAPFNINPNLFGEVYRAPTPPTAPSGPPAPPTKRETSFYHVRPTVP